MSSPPRSPVGPSVPPFRFPEPAAGQSDDAKRPPLPASPHVSAGSTPSSTYVTVASAGPAPSVVLTSGAPGPQTRPQPVPTKPVAQPYFSSSPPPLDMEHTRLLGTGWFGNVYVHREDASRNPLEVRKVFQSTATTLASVGNEQALFSTANPSEADRVRIEHSDGHLQLVMPYLGEHPDQAIAKKPLDSRQSFARLLACSAADEVARVHANGIVHRDIKASNLGVLEGSHGPCVRLFDFGSAAERTNPDMRFVGTPPLQAPYRITQTEQQDVYALARLCLCWLVTPDAPLDSVKGMRSKAIAKAIAALDENLRPLFTKILIDGNSGEGELPNAIAFAEELRRQLA